MSESSNSAWPFGEIPDEEGLDIAAIFKDSAGTVDQGNVTAATAILTMVYNILTHGENLALQTDFSTRTIRMQTVLEKQPRRKAA